MLTELTADQVQDLLNRLGMLCQVYSIAAQRGVTMSDVIWLSDARMQRIVIGILFTSTIFKEHFWLCLIRSS